MYMKYPKKLKFLITDVHPTEFEFDANISVGDTIEGEFIGVEEYEDCDGNFIEYANYQTKELPEYPLMVEIDFIDSDNVFYSHHSFGYLIKYYK